MLRKFSKVLLKFANNLAADYYSKDHGPSKGKAKKSIKPE